MAYHKIGIIYFMDKRALGNLKFVRANKSFSLIPRSNNLSVMLILTSTKPMTFQIYSLGKATSVNINFLSVILPAHLVFVFTVA